MDDITSPSEEPVSSRTRSRTAPAPATASAPIEQPTRHATSPSPTHAIQSAAVSPAPADLFHEPPSAMLAPPTVSVLSTIPSLLLPVSSAFAAIRETPREAHVTESAMTRGHERFFAEQRDYEPALTRSASSRDVRPGPASSFASRALYRPLAPCPRRTQSRS